MTNQAKHVLASIIATVVVIIAVGAYWSYTHTDNAVVDPARTTVFDPYTATYNLDGELVTFVAGHTSATADIFGEPIFGDLDGDGDTDAVVMVTKENGGSGTFFYVAVAINTPEGTIGTPAVFLGDRIAPQHVNIDDERTIVVNYATRAIDEPMTASPSIGVTDRLIVEGIDLIRKPPEIVSYVISTEDPTLYCNGADMDSEGYRQTIKREQSASTTLIHPTKVQMIKEIIDLATTGTCREAFGALDITEEDGTVTIPPFDGWAGVSIVLCRCRPEVEVNLLRISGITDVVWAAE